MSEDPLAAIDDASAWSDFCANLDRAREVILRPGLARSSFDRAEGLRYLGRLLRAGLQVFGEQLGPAYPTFRAQPELVKMGLDNPDNYYLGASVSPRHTYRIRGQRGSIHYMSFAAQSQNFAAKDRITGGAGHLNDDEIEMDADGRFEIIASVDEQPGNWLRMTKDTSQVLLRQTFLDKQQETPVSVEIECLGVDEPPPPLDPARVGGALNMAAAYAMGCASWFADWVQEFAEKAPPNEFHLPDEESHRIVGGDPNIRLWLGLWELAPDEALVIEAKPPRCHYWNFQLGNVWAESLEYRFRRTHINSGHCHYEPDGSFRLVVAHRDPGVPNWLDTAGHDHGTMGLRWVRAQELPEPHTRVVKLSELG